MLDSGMNNCLEWRSELTCLAADLIQSNLSTSCQWRTREHIGAVQEAHYLRTIAGILSSQHALRGIMFGDNLEKRIELYAYHIVESPMSRVELKENLW